MFISWNIKDVQRTSSSRLGGGRLGGVVRYVVTINDIIVPISLTRLESSALKSECTFPCTGFG